MKDEYIRIIKDAEGAGIEGALIATRDGLLIYSDMEKIPQQAFAAMCATILSSSEVAMDEIGAGIPEKVVVAGKSKKIMIVGAGKEYLLAVVLSANVDADEVVFEAARKIAAVSEKK